MSSLSVWIVDDMEPDHFLLKWAFREWLSEENFRSFFSAEDALEATRGGEVPSLLLLDLKMPGMDGLDFLSELRERALPRFPIVVWSASLKKDRVQRAYELGASSYFEKPVAVAQYRGIARSVFQYWFKAAVLPRGAGS